MTTIKEAKPRPRKLAWVSGTAGCYTLHVHRCVETTHFQWLNTWPFGSYARAQSMATAIHNHATRKGAK